MEKLTLKELKEKAAYVVKEHGGAYVTEDGNVFLPTEQGKNYAYGHASGKRMEVHTFGKVDVEAKNDDNHSDDGSNNGEGEGNEVTLDSLMKLKKTELVAKAEEVGAEFETDNNKETIAKAIISAIEEEVSAEGEGAE